MNCPNQILTWQTSNDKTDKEIDYDKTINSNCIHNNANVNIYINDACLKNIIICQISNKCVVGDIKSDMNQLTVKHNLCSKNDRFKVVEELS